MIFGRAALAEELNRSVYEAIALEVTSRIKLQMPVGMIIPYAGTGAIPDGYVECNGQSVSSGAPAGARDPDYRPLFQVIGLSYTPVEGRTDHTFRLPDFRGRVLMGAGQGSGLSERKMGEHPGEETHKLTLNEMPAHEHTLVDPGHTHGVTDGGHSHPSSHPGVHGNGGYNRGDNAGGLGQFSTTAASRANISIDSSPSRITMNSAGGGGDHNNIQPSAVIRYLIRWKGEIHGAVADASPRQVVEKHPEETIEAREPASQVEKVKK